jgi:translation initiation factor 1A
MSWELVFLFYHGILSGKLKIYKTPQHFIIMDEFEQDNGEEVTEENQNLPVRVRLPRGKEVIGIIEQRYGGNKMLVRCLDGKERNCRVPGRLKRGLWLRPGDVVIIEPWDLDPDKKGDVLFKYRPNQIEWLRRKGLLKEEKSEF